MCVCVFIVPISASAFHLNLNPGFDCIRIQNPSFRRTWLGFSKYFKKFKESLRSRIKYYEFRVKNIWIRDSNLNQIGNWIPWYENRMSYFLFLSLFFHFGYLITKEKLLPHNFSIRSEKYMVQTVETKEKINGCTAQCTHRNFCWKNSSKQFNVFFHVCNVVAVVVVIVVITIIFVILID